MQSGVRPEQVPAAGRFGRIDAGLTPGDRHRARGHAEPRRLATGQAGERRRADSRHKGTPGGSRSRRRRNRHRNATRSRHPRRAHDARRRPPDPRHRTATGSTAASPRRFRPVRQRPIGSLASSSSRLIRSGSAKTATLRYASTTSVTPGQARRAPRPPSRRRSARRRTGRGRRDPPAAPRRSISWARDVLVGYHGDQGGKTMLILGLMLLVAAPAGESVADRITLRDGSKVLGLVTSTTSGAGLRRVPGEPRLGRAECAGPTRGVEPRLDVGVASGDRAASEAAVGMATGAGAIAGRRRGRPHPPMARRRAGPARRPGRRGPDSARARPAAASGGPTARPSTGRVEPLAPPRVVGRGPTARVVDDGRTGRRRRGAGSSSTRRSPARRWRSMACCRRRPSRRPSGWPDAPPPRSRSIPGSASSVTRTTSSPTRAPAARSPRLDPSMAMSEVARSARPRRQPQSPRSDGPPAAIGRPARPHRCCGNSPDDRPRPRRGHGRHDVLGPRHAGNGSSTDRGSPPSGSMTSATTTAPTWRPTRRSRRPSESSNRSASARSRRP